MPRPTPAFRRVLLRRSPVLARLARLSTLLKAGAPFAVARLPSHQEGACGMMLAARPTIGREFGFQPVDWTASR